MASTVDPLEVNDLLKSATIYRNSESNYIYVCYHCASTFINIVDTLEHIESHFDAKVIIYDDDKGFQAEYPESETDEQTVNNLFMNDVNPMLLDDEPNEFDCKVILQEDIKYSEYFKADVKPDISEVTTTDGLCQVMSKCKKTVKVETAKRPWTKYQLKFLKTCDICSSIFSNRTMLISHMKNEHCKQKNVCEKCNRSIGRKFAFYAHHYGHLTNGDRVNDLDNEVLRQNLRTFLDDNIYCDESTSTFTCKICDHVPLGLRKSAQDHILQNHIYNVKSSAKEKRFSCEYCGKKFSNNSNFNAHKLTHSQDKPYTCSTCNKSFSQPSYLKSHEQTHSDLRPVQCATCGATFKTVTRLNYHIRRNHLIVPSKCPICHKELKHLMTHMRDVHQNEHRPHTCSICLQSFKTRKTLRVHMYRHSGEKNFQCRFDCNERFISTAGRRAHERSRH